MVTVNKTLLKTVLTVAEDEIVFLFRDECFSKVLTPGRHSVWGRNLSWRTFQVPTLFFEEIDRELLVRQHEAIRDLLHIHKNGNDEIALLYLNEQLQGIVAPGEAVYLWKNAGDIRLETIPLIQNVVVDAAVLDEMKTRSMNLASAMIAGPDTRQPKPVLEVSVAERELGFIFRNGSFEQIVGKGEYGFWQIKDRVEAEVHRTDSLYFTAKNADSLFRDHEAIRQHVESFRMNNDEAGLLYLNGQLQGVIAPGEQVYAWKAAGDLMVKRVWLAEESRVERSVLDELRARDLNHATELLSHSGADLKAPVLEVTVPAQHAGVFYEDGAMSATLTPGVYGFWALNRNVDVRLFDLRTRTLEIAGQEILTRDKVSVRINLTASVRTTDVMTAAGQVDDLDEYLYKSVQLALREAVGTRTLDQLLEDKLYVNETVKTLVEDEFAAAGVSLNRVGVKDIILPGEIRTILNQVVEAQKAAEANVIRRREETAATRSLHNTAKLMEDNPTLMRLKELESLEKVSEKVDKINVYGGLEGLMNATVQLG